MKPIKSEINPIYQNFQFKFDGTAEFVIWTDPLFTPARDFLFWQVADNLDMQLKYDI